MFQTVIIDVIVGSALGCMLQIWSSEEPALFFNVLFLGTYVCLHFFLYLCVFQDKRRQYLSENLKIDSWLKYSLQKKNIDIQKERKQKNAYLFSKKNLKVGKEKFYD